MTTYYVATRAMYVLVDAPNEDEARTKALPAFAELRDDRNAVIEICTVRPATDDEIELARWDAEHREDPAPDAADWV